MMSPATRVIGYRKWHKFCESESWNIAEAGYGGESRERQHQNTVKGWTCLC